MVSTGISGSHTVAAMSQAFCSALWVWYLGPT